MYIDFPDWMPENHLTYELPEHYSIYSTPEHSSLQQSIKEHNRDCAKFRYDMEPIHQEVNELIAILREELTPPIDEERRRMDQTLSAMDQEIESWQGIHGELLLQLSKYKMREEEKLHTTKLGRPKTQDTPWWKRNTKKAKAIQ